jgi:hypothetical protein
MVNSRVDPKQLFMNTATTRALESTWLVVRVSPHIRCEVNIAKLESKNCKRKSELKGYSRFAYIHIEDNLIILRAKKILNGANRSETSVI